MTVYSIAIPGRPVPKGRPRLGVRGEEDEVALLIMHLRRQGQIQLRPGGVFGKREIYDEAI